MSAVQPVTAVIFKFFTFLSVLQTDLCLDASTAERKDKEEFVMSSTREYWKVSQRKRVA
jgi:hypothetical protein